MLPGDWPPLHSGSSINKQTQSWKQNERLKFSFVGTDVNVLLQLSLLFYNLSCLAYILKTCYCGCACQIHSWSLWPVHHYGNDTESLVIKSCHLASAFLRSFLTPSTIVSKVLLYYFSLSNLDSTITTWPSKTLVPSPLL